MIVPNSGAVATITCPECGHSSKKAMPADICLYFYKCLGCGVVLRPKKGECCVFCSYGDMPCPSKQSELDESAD